MRIENPCITPARVGPACAVFGIIALILEKVRMRNQLIVLCAAGLLATPLTRADDKPDVLELLKQVDKATKALTEVSYEATYKGLDKAEAKVPKITFKAKAKKGKS